MKNGERVGDDWGRRSMMRKSGRRAMWGVGWSAGFGCVLEPACWTLSVMNARLENFCKLEIKQRARGITPRETGVFPLGPPSVPDTPSRGRQEFISRRRVVARGSPLVVCWKQLCGCSCVDFALFLQKPLRRTVFRRKSKSNIRTGIQIRAVRGAFHKGYCGDRSAQFFS